MVGDLGGVSRGVLYITAIEDSCLCVCWSAQSKGFGFSQARVAPHNHPNSKKKSIVWPHTISDTSSLPYCDKIAF